jgi:hypothetical protein
MVYGHPPDECPLINPEERIPICFAMNLDENPIWRKSKLIQDAPFLPNFEARGEEDAPESQEFFEIMDEEDADDPGSFLAEASDSTEADIEETGRPPKTIAEIDLSVLPNTKREVLLTLFEQSETTTPSWQTLSEQLLAIIGTLRDEKFPTPWRIIGQLFGVSKGAIRSYYQRALSNRMTGMAGRPSILTEEEQQWLSLLIQERFAQQSPITCSEILNEIELEFGKFILPNTLFHMIARASWCKTVHGIPMEASRVQCSEEAINDYFSMLETCLSDAPCAVIYNVDEVGFDEWVDATRSAVVVPSDYPADTIPFPVRRVNSRASMIACISAAGRALKPVVVLPRKTAECEFFECGFTPDEVSLVWQENGFCTAKLFEEWCFTVFLPDVLEQRQRLGYAGFVFLILDGFSGHTTEAIEEEFLRYGVFAITLPPHSSDQIQPLDLGIFAIQKVESRRIHAHLDLNPQTRKLIKMLCGWHKATTPVNIIAAFRNGGIVGRWCEEAKALVCQIDRNAASQRRQWNGQKGRVCITAPLAERG